MSIYSELSYLFKLAEELKELQLQDDAEEETKELSKEFNEKYSDLISKTYEGEDQIFMRDGFREVYKDLIQWSKNYCNQNMSNKIENFENILKINPNNDNDININMLNNMNMNNDKNQNQKFQEEDKNYIRQSNDSSINLIRNNYMNNISENNSYNNNIANNYNMVNNNEYKISINSNLNNNLNENNNNNIKENNNIEEDSEEVYEEEEEEDDNDEDKDDNNYDIINEFFEEEEEEEEEVKVEYGNQEKDDSFNSNDNYINVKNDNCINIKEGININIKNGNNSNAYFDEESDDSGKNRIDKIIGSYNSKKQNSDSDSDSSEENSNSDSEVGREESNIDGFLKITIKDLFKSFIKEGDNTKFNSKYMELKELINNKEKMKTKYKDKIITLMCILFPFCTRDQKRFIYESDINDEKLEIYLHETLLYFDDKDTNEKYKKISEILNNIPKKYDKEKKNYNLDLIFDKNLFLNSKEELMLLYQFLVIYKSFGAKSAKNTKTFDSRFYLSHFYFISFKIYFILTHQELYPCITDEIFDIFEKLLFMKIFYKNAFSHKLENPYIISKMKTKNKDNEEIGYKYNNFILGKPKDINIEDLFDKDELELNEEIIRTLSNFYKIDKDKGIDLLYFSNNPELDRNKNQYNFIINIIDLLYIKRNMILHENDKFKGNLLNLEKDIHQKVSFLFKKDNQEGYCSKFAMNSKLKRIYSYLIKELIEELKNRSEKKSGIKLENINFYPIGSTAEFLYKNEDDLNIYLDIHKLNTSQKKNILHDIKHYLREKYSASKKINKDNCIFYFKYEETFVSLIVLGNGPYIHSLLFREYALMDPRFPIVAIALKIFLKQIGIKTNTNNNSMPKDSFLNTYSFMSLLVAFLQDIISPPILPKILSDKNSQLISKGIPYISELNEKKINTFVDSIKFTNIHLPKSIFKKEELKKIYTEQIGNNKNNLSCAEIFLHFLEFLIFYFKFDTLYVNSSLDYEGFDSMNNLINEDDDNEDTLKEKNPNDINFKEYFKKNYYTKRKDKEEKEIDKEKGLFLIRDPVNPFHNSASSLNNKKKNLYQNFFFKLKKGYIKLLKKGNFNSL